jgi:hypothetical protein
MVGQQMLVELEKDGNPKWLSTHGLGVYHLHVRICNSPKYYTHTEYKTSTYKATEISRPPERNRSPEDSDSSRPTF